MTGDTVPVTEAGSSRRNVTTTLGPHLLERLDRMAEAEGRNRRDMIADCILAAVEAWEDSQNV